ncbi:hypothetical protein SBBP2_2920004 [Burkholderiales bacterium]|nr:hypothetical protein SBBP2_2920004 [Burkholderiales bacterium]
MRLREHAGKLRLNFRLSLQQLLQGSFLASHALKIAFKPCFNRKRFGTQHLVYKDSPRRTHCGQCPLH